MRTHWQYASMTTENEDSDQTLIKSLFDWICSNNVVAILVASMVTAVLVSSMGGGDQVYDENDISLHKNAKQIEQTLVEMANLFDGSNIDDHACRLNMQLVAYDLKKDALRNGHRYTSFYSNMCRSSDSI